MDLKNIFINPIVTIQANIITLILVYNRLSKICLGCKNKKYQCNDTGGKVKEDMYCIIHLLMVHYGCYPS